MDPDGLDIVNAPIDIRVANAAPSRGCFFQITSALVTIRNHLREARGGELGGYGLLHNDPLHDAAVRHHVHRMLPVEDEQGTWLHDVSALLRFRRRFPDVRVQVHQVPVLVAFLLFLYRGK